MMYEERCQLGFNDPSTDIFYFGQDQEDHYQYQTQQQPSLINSTNIRFEQTSEGEDCQENRDDNIQMRDQPSRSLYTEGTLKLNHDKKVQFSDQLAFKLDSLPLFQGEVPAPIEFKNNPKPGLPKQKKGKKIGKGNKKGLAFAPPSLKRRPGSAAIKAQVKSKPLPVWNDNTARASNFFDPALDKKSKKQQELQEARSQMQTNQLSNIPVVNKNYEEGKFDIAFMKSNGQPSSKFQMYSNIDQLNDDTHKTNYAATGYSLKTLSKPQKQLLASTSPQKKQKQVNKDIQIAQYSEGHKHEVNVHQVNQGNDQLKNLVGSALNSKETMIQLLEQELQKEQLRRTEMSDMFKQQLKDFEEERDALERIRLASLRMEKNQQQKDWQRTHQEKQMELDMVPTKQSARAFSSAKKSSSRVNTLSTYRKDRVKTSIPKAPKGYGSSPSQMAKKDAAKYIEELKKQEVTRAVKLQEEEKMTAEILTRFRDNPNAKLQELQTEVTLLNRKVEPLLQKVEQAAKNIYQVSNTESSLKNAKGPIGMLSKMGGRLISFYADDLADLLLDDYLVETAVELQSIEKSFKKDYSGEEAKQTAQLLLKTLVDYQSEEHLVSMKWTNPAIKKQMNAIGLSGMQRDPQPITFNLNDDDYTQDHQISPKKKEEQKTASKGAYQNPFGKVDPFSQGLTQSYNVMERLDNITESQQNQSMIELKGGQDHIYEVKRKYKVQIDKEQLHSIVLYKEKYEQFLKMHNNTCNKDVWKVYDHLTADIFAEIYKEVLGTVNTDLEQYIEKVIFDEFQLNQ